MTQIEFDTEIKILFGRPNGLRFSGRPNGYLKAILPKKQKLAFTNFRRALACPLEALIGLRIYYAP
jgi:hypothetical protein